MAWLQLSIDSSETEALLLELAFENLGALSVTLGDAGNQPLLEIPPKSEQLWEHTRMTALFEGHQDPLTLRSALAAALDERVIQRLHWPRIEDQIYEQVWLEHFKPMSFGRRLWVCPEGESIDQANEDAAVIQLDPGLAFGTGTHPTTALCLEWLDAQDLQGKMLIDHGCGSGILAIAALKLGALSVVAVDHDPQALEASKNSAEKNDVADRLKTYLPDGTPDQQFDLLVANILAGPLIQLAPTLTQLIIPGGHFALSGILAKQQLEVATCYQSFASLTNPKQCQEWILISGTTPTYESDTSTVFN
ncbi:MAG: 50S ribosomal protein L11 methyltransferase [Candidatus Thiodiazotropha sp. (ex Lucinoma aequizonata)]|nr:50S ribosomal protein L11 methyltransferase [Candidatus Thiodiazotropha sp. (ex Lucinoma aequizonata)]MCU7887990.1 50S ribosomal protein L11 methyltransferase [Candidatus Thiodiazotropha sp. (ex Lucinoma aequizonata)]MCU7896395.1 50S ribosomal protein L11 methyltransferase [Candidatus Thiodiazotropha sp. (ex Lucinoma aequizonata)]MCU7898492.1 50S ribosomal protein L11 methyltransferase [Candidatus Thiodiazotropha sp. (ex Lucinoma aequizonata)]MCU7901150.1 50S ribosomal protein L11 methyltran